MITGYQNRYLPHVERKGCDDDGQLWTIYRIYVPNHWVFTALYHYTHVVSHCISIREFYFFFLLWLFLEEYSCFFFPFSTFFFFLNVSMLNFTALPPASQWNYGIMIFPLVLSKRLIFDDLELFVFLEGECSEEYR